MSDRLPVPSTNQQVTLLVADDDDADVIRKTLRDFLQVEPAIKVLGEASNFAETISHHKSDEETRLLAENLGAVRMLDKTKLCDELIPAILQTEN